MDSSYHITMPAISFADALTAFIDKGYKQTFRREPGRLYCIELYRWIAPDQFTVDESWYFEAAAKPDTNRLVYAISTGDGLKGILVDSWGAYADNISPEMFEKLGLDREQPGNDRRNTLRVDMNTQKTTSRGHP